MKNDDPYLANDGLTANGQGRLKSSANFMVLPFFVPFVLAIGGDRPTPIDPHESGGGGRSLDLKTTKRHEAEPASS